MKMKSITMMLAAMAFVFGMSSCGSDDDAPEAPLATQVAGSYGGNEVIVVDNEESSNETKAYQITKASDTTIDIVIPQVGMGMMTIPSVTVKNIPLVKDGNTIKGALGNYEGTLKADDGSEKAYTISNLVVLFSDKTVVVTFAEKYGRMPFSLYTTFTGTKK